MLQQDVSAVTIERYRQVQHSAKETMAHLSSFIVPGITERDIKQEAEAYMTAHGIESFWYYDIGAFVFAGKRRTALSISGKQYVPENVKIKSDDIVTVDLSPCIGAIWGDYARTILLDNDQLSYGIDFQIHLHDVLKKKTRSDMAFGDLFAMMNEEIERHGFVNVDGNRNMGHTIEVDRDARRYLEDGNTLTISSARLFTFEPHIRKKDGVYGFKMENIYYVENGQLVEL